MAIKLNVCGMRVKLARIEREMKQVDLSAALQVDHEIEMSQNAISDLENGERHVKDIELLAFAEILNKHPMWFLFGDEIPEKYQRK